MAIFKEISPNDIKTNKSLINQIVDVIQSDISGSSLDNTRRKYQVFLTGGIGPGVTSSLYHTIYDQDYTLQTANPIFDMTFGLYYSSSIVLSCSTGTDLFGKELFPSQSLMMREKMDIYRQFAGALLGDTDGQFIAPYGSTDATNKIDAALFFGFKRLFFRDQIKKDTFALKFFMSASATDPTTTPIKNLNVVSTIEPRIYTDVTVDTNKIVNFGGLVGNIVEASNTNNSVGLIFYDRGICVFDLEKIVSGSDIISGTINAVNSSGQVLLSPTSGGGYTVEQTVIPDLIVSASIDDILDHVCTTRFSDSSTSAAMTFQNVTNINSTLVFCNAGPDEFNYSSNPTYIDSTNQIMVIEDLENDKSFTYITSIGLYDANDNLLAIAKLSRPVKKDSSKNLNFKVRLDF